MSATASRASRAIALALALALPWWAWPGTALAYRPFDQTDAGVTETHEIELELGPVGYARDATGATFIPGFIFNYGVVHRVELVLDAHHAFLFGGPGAALRRRQLDSALLAKIVVREGVLQDRPGPSVAIELGPLLPTVPIAGHAGASATVIASERWPALAVHVDVEGDYTRAGTFAFIGGFIVEGPDGWTVRPVSEFLLAHESHLPTVASGLLGAIWRASPHVSFDAAGRLIDDGARATELRAGLTWSFEP